MSNKPKDSKDKYIFLMCKTLPLTHCGKRIYSTLEMLLLCHDIGSCDYNVIFYLKNLIFIMKV